jgi:putative hydrolase of the HAD superfamily
MDNFERRRLISLIRESSMPIIPDPPALPPEFEALHAKHRETGKFRAVLFDVYGTLFCSAAGDIAVSHNTAAAGRETALNSLAESCGVFGVDLQSWFHDKVAEIHRLRSACTNWPEVDVEEIWGDREFALRYELAVNPVYPMPSALKTIKTLKKSGCILGIISNAQFYTPLLFEAFFDASPVDLGFDPELLIWSHEAGEAKPSPKLFQTAAERLAARGIEKKDCAFIGNDMLSDIYGASNAGFYTVLYAGDRRSLRLRETEALTSGLRPSAVARDLAELLNF